MNKETDIDKALTENPDLPREFVEKAVEATKEVERGEHTQYRRGQRDSSNGESSGNGKELT